jgi:hypothetical protein
MPPGPLVDRVTAASADKASLTRWRNLSNIPQWKAWADRVQSPAKIPEINETTSSSGQVVSLGDK